MVVTMNEYKAKFIMEILFADSQAVVNKLCEAAIKNLAQNSLNPELTTIFVEDVIYELEQFNPLNRETQQWSNIKMARILLNRMRRKLNASEH